MVYHPYDGHLARGMKYLQLTVNSENMLSESGQSQDHVFEDLI